MLASCFAVSPACMVLGSAQGFAQSGCSR
jgi:hypothetical protein